MATIDVKHNYSLEELSLQNPDMAKKVHEITKEVLNRARNAMRDKVRDVSTKEAYRAVRKSVYTKIFGGNVNIASTHKVGAFLCKSKPICGIYRYYRMDTIELENNVKLDQLLTTNPEMEKKVRRIVRQVIIGAMDPVKQAADRQSTRQAAQAIRKAVYKKVLGGNINILDGRGKAGGRGPLPPESARKRSHAVGGNRMPRSRRTEDLLTYQGKDTAFILRFLNSGTPRRSTNGIRKVGQIAARHWFEDTSHRSLQYAAEQFDKLLDALIAKEFK